MAAGVGSHVASCFGTDQAVPLHPLRAALHGREIWAGPPRYRLRRRAKGWSRLVNATLVGLGLIAGPAVPLVGILLIASQSDRETNASALVARLCQALPDRAMVAATNAGFCSVDVETAAGTP
jgi:hypothetical protein